MKLIRVRTTIGIDYMKDQLLPDDTPVEKMVEVLKQCLLRQPEETYILQAYEGDDLQAFIIAFAAPTLQHVWLQQAWVSEKAADPKISEKLFLRLLLWTDSLGRSEVRMETKRDEAMSRRWNFQTHSKIMSFKLDENMDSKLLEGRHNVLVGKEDSPQEGLSAEGDSNGRQRRKLDENEVGTEREPEALGQGLGTVSAVESNLDCGAIHRRVSGTTDAGDDAGSAVPGPVQSDTV